MSELLETAQPDIADPNSHDESVITPLEEDKIKAAIAKQQESDSTTEPRQSIDIRESLIQSFLSTQFGKNLSENVSQQADIFNEALVSEEMTNEKRKLLSDFARTLAEEHKDLPYIPTLFESTAKMLWGKDRTAKDLQNSVGLFFAYTKIKPYLEKGLTEEVTSVSEAFIVYLFNKRALTEDESGKPVFNKEYTFLYDMYFLMDLLLHPEKIDKPESV